MRRRGFLALFLALTLTACGWEGFVTDNTSPTPEQAATPSSVPWEVTVKKPHSGMFGIAWDPTDQLDPLLTTNRVNREMYNLIYDSLFVLDEAFQPHGSLCSNIATEDNRRFLITLRENVLFHNGQPLTAQDVADSFQTARSDASPYATRFSSVLSVKASEGVVEVVLSEPNERFAALLTFPIVKAGDKSFPPSGTGPYTMGGGEGRSYLTPFENWWRGEALPLGHIELNAANKLEDISYLMSVGDVSLVTSDANDNFGVGFNGDFDIWEFPTPTMYYVGFNMSHPALSDKRVRQALSCAFDRRGLVAEVFKNAADPAAAAVSPALSDSSDGYDPVRYTELIGEAGLADTDNDGVLDFQNGRVREPLALRFVVDEDDAAACSAAGFLAKPLEGMGISVTVEVLPKTQLEADIASGAYGLVCAKTTLTPDFRLTRWGGVATGTSLEAQTNAFMDEMPVAPLLFKRGQVLTHWSEVTGIKPVYGNPFANISEWTVVK